MNRMLAPGLSSSLLQFFVDEVAALNCRADACLLMNRARELRAELVHIGWNEKELPKLVGQAGTSWLYRWRKLYGISKRATGMKLKVSWKKIRHRVKVHLTNLFRLRAFWDLCHPDKPMRFLSVDQKPSWFNNAGHTGTYAKKGGAQPTVRENFNATRQRYTILTSVPSWGHDDSNVPPKVALLFKGKPGGGIQGQFDRSLLINEWTKVQVQENGSYRSPDVVEALDWMLPAANDSSESIIVMLDWFSGHLTEEVAALVRNKGHVLLFHGGGCTPFTQINDTHLHASLARILNQLEVDWALKRRQDDKLAGLPAKTPQPDREDILALVQAAWQDINHHNVADKGYKQTGPTLPMTGPWSPEDIFKDLRHVLDQITPPTDPTTSNTQLRDESVEYVKDGFKKKLFSTWADCYKLIEEHTPGCEATPEGMEAFVPDPYDEHEEGSDDDDDDTGGGGDGGCGGAGPGLAAPPADGEPGSGSGGGGADGGADGAVDGADTPGGAPGAGRAAPVGGSRAAAAYATVPDLAAARRVLYDHALQHRDDIMAQRLRRQMLNEDRDAKMANTQTGQELKKRVAEQRAEDAKRRRTAIEEQRLAAKNIEELKLLRAQADQKKEEARLQALKQSIIERREVAAMKDAEAIDRITKRWIQTEYPVVVARRLLDWCRGTQTQPFADAVKRLQDNNTFSNYIFIPELWIPDPSLTADLGPILVGSQHTRQVRCGSHFRDFIDTHAPSDRFARVDAAETLRTLFKRCIPQAKHMFTQTYSIRRIFQKNEYVMEMAFIYGVIAASKWLGRDKFPFGIYGAWPPALPAEQLPPRTASEAIRIENAAL